MKRLFFALLVTCSGLVACIETETHTSINDDGSGVSISMVDMSEMMSLMAGTKSEEKMEDIQMDSLIRFSSLSDTATNMSAREKELLKDLTIRMQISSTSKVMKFTITAPFKKMEDLQELNELIASNHFDKYFDQAIKGAGLSEESPDETAEESTDPTDNLFGSVFPDFFKCSYKKGLIKCEIDSEKEKSFQARWKEMADNEEEAGKEIMELVKFTNRISLPSNAKKTTGEKLKEGSSKKEWIQEGNLLELYESPAKYEYSITY